MSISILWFRRDLRLSDHPALLAAIGSSDEVLPVFVWDPVLIGDGGARVQRLAASLAALSADTGGALVVRTGDPAEVIADLAAEADAREIHVTRESTPYGRRRDQRVRARLERDGRELVETGSPYAVGPGRVRNRTGEPYKVFTPFSRAWHEHGWPRPGERPGEIAWATGHHSADPAGPGSRSTAGRGAARGAVKAVEAGERAALARWRAFLDEDLDGYAEQRDRPDLDTTSRLSVHLKYGEIHPRTILAELAEHPAAGGESARRFVTELAWREFYADILWHWPRSAWRDLRDALAGMAYDEGPEAGELVEAWKQGLTGYPVVDAGMRQLLAEGWMHNRVRMITASFLVKDLHVWWPVGARHFLDHLIDGDIASNNHGWQWVAGTGTDASPWFRVFNPVTQGLRFDPAGEYVRRWVPELAHLPGAAAHEPWRSPDGYRNGYPERIVDHAEERLEALRRYDVARGSEN
ncbi:deoxyribodipyrimidine photo-lyase [Rhodococcus sp. IEGM 1408]|uniref:cryptochrome/photolyase family protein n=1 Tax=Rhodococcus sp. IEGM 1408 TaxID=3082220 RepID=UPI00295318B4|nr:deoxyribodipyrimidine photo-lyase [Rhodococcus sp. IEGM 1408]MDV8002546.1 deoxyribodipyrimidine photo-lyase [Rhodococcus sp. IEGM 1408]